jgi:hypothetical protein
MVATVHESDDVIERRRQQPLEVLLGETIKWLAGLPAEVRPTSLPIQYVRITNTLARVWPDHRRCLQYLDDLLIDRRGGRQGFAFDVALEIAGLKDYYETTIYPTAQTAWDLISVRR